jgi:geranylgeranyl diphosphate synthase, type II
MVMDAFAVQSSELSEMRGLVDRALAQMLPDETQSPRRLHAAMRHAVLGPGKRIRPILALLSARHLGCTSEAAMPAACALELVHAASLVLDDLPCMDDAPERRGQPSVHAGFGEDVAVLTGVALLNEAFAAISRAAHFPDAARVAMTSLLTTTVGPQGLIGGQHRDLMGVDAPSLGDLADLHREKTGVLFVASVEMGALAAGAGPTARDALRIFGLELGLAFQALDDLDDEDDLIDGRETVNLLSVMDRDGLRQEADRRLNRAKAALSDGAPELAPMGRYVDLLFHRLAA